MIVVLDASAAAKLVLNTAGKQIIDSVSSAEMVVVPDLFIAEINSVFWKYHRFNQLPVAECEFLIDQALQLADDTVSAIGLYREAFTLAVQTGVTVYDSLYLVLARRQGAYLATSDKRLIGVAQKNAIRVVAE